MKISKSLQEGRGFFLYFSPKRKELSKWRFTYYMSKIISEMNYLYSNLPALPKTFLKLMEKRKLKCQISY